MRAVNAGSFAPVRRGARGSQTVEFAVVSLLFLGFLFLLVDVGWSVFVKATLGHAVRCGSRFAVTGQTKGTMNQLDSIKSVVQNQAMGLLSGAQASTIHIHFYDAVSLAETVSPSAGSVVVVSVDQYSLLPLAPLGHKADQVLLTVQAGDRVELGPQS